MNKFERNEEVKCIFQDMPPSIPFMERYRIIGEVTFSNESSVRAWISCDNKRFIPAAKLMVLKNAAAKYGAGLVKRVGQHVTSPT